MKKDWIKEGAERFQNAYDDAIASLGVPGPRSYVDDEGLWHDADTHEVLSIDECDARGLDGTGRS